MGCKDNRGPMKTFGDDRYGYVHYLYCGDVFRGIHIRQNIKFPTSNMYGQSYTNYVSCVGSLYVSTWLGHGSQVFVQPSAQVLLWYFLDVINMGISRLLSKADCPPECGWASSNQVKALKERLRSQRRNESCLQSSDSNSLLSVEPAGLPGEFWNCQPPQSHELIT